MLRNATVFLFVVIVALYDTSTNASRMFRTGNPLFTPCIESAIDNRTQEFPCSAIVGFDKDANESHRNEALNGAGLLNAHRFGRVKSDEVVINDRGAYLSLLSSAHVESLTPNRILRAHGKPTPSPVGQLIPSNIVRIGATADLRGNIDGSGIGVAVLDTGVDLANTDLRISGNCFTAFSSCQDGNGHGTHVSGIAAALNNSIGVVGVAPGATIYAVKVLDNSGNGSDATMMQGLEWILNNATTVNPPIRVVNASLGRHGSANDNPALHDLIIALKSAGIAVVVSAGNEANYEVSQMVPAGYPEVIAVASTTALQGARSSCRNFPDGIPKDTASSFSTDGALSASGVGVTVSAPGEESENILKTCALQSVGILSLARGSGTTRMSGTSMAAPHVAGSIALYLQQNGSVDVDAIKSHLRSSAFTPGLLPLDSAYGSYSFDGEREGVLSVCALLGKACP